MKSPTKSESNQARMRLQGLSQQADPDPEQVLLSIASLPNSTDAADPGSDLSLAILAARAVAEAARARVKSANATMRLPDDDEWSAIVSHFGLDESFYYGTVDQLQYARAFRALR